MVLKQRDNGFFLYIENTKSATFCPLFLVSPLFIHNPTPIIYNRRSGFRPYYI